MSAPKSAAHVRLSATARARLAQGHAPALDSWLVDLLDGSRDSDALLRDARSLTPPHGPLEVVGLLERGQQSGLIDGWRDAQGRRSLHLHLPIPLLGRMLGIGRFLPPALPRKAASAGFMLLSAVLGWLGLSGQLHAVLSPFAVQASPLVALAHLWLLAAGLGSLRAAARALSLVSAGHAVPSAVLRARRGLLWLDADDRDAKALSRQERRDLAWIGLGLWAAVCALSAAAYAASHAALARELASVALLALLADLTPYLDTDGRDLVALAARVPDLGKRSRSWLLRRVVRNMREQVPIGPVERAYLWVSSAWLAHALLTLTLLLAGLLPAAIELAVRSASRPAGLAGALPLLGILCVVAALSTGLALVAASFVRQGAAFAERERPTQATALGQEDAADFARAAAAIPFLGRLGSDVLGDLAATASRESYATDSIILRQGTPGDRFCFLASGQAIVAIEEESGLRHDVARLGPGDFFGETALVEPIPRTASVIAASDVVLFTFGRDQFLSIVSAAGADGAQVREQIRNAAALRGHPLFHGLGRDGFRRLLEQVRVHVCQDSEVIVRQGERGETFYVIREGACSVLHRDGERERKLADLGAGNWFGEVALIGGDTRTATVIASAGTVLLEVPRDVADDALVEDVAAATHLAAIAAERLACIALGCGA